MPMRVLLFALVSFTACWLPTEEGAKRWLVMRLYGTCPDPGLDMHIKGTLIAMRAYNFPSIWLSIFFFFKFIYLFFFFFLITTDDTELNINYHRIMTMEENADSKTKNKILIMIICLVLAADIFVPLFVLCARQDVEYFCPGTSVACEL